MEHTYKSFIIQPFPFEFQFKIEIHAIILFPFRFILFISYSNVQKQRKISKFLLLSEELKPATYRIRSGRTIHSANEVFRYIFPNFADSPSSYFQISNWNTYTIILFTLSSIYFKFRSPLIFATYYLQIWWAGKTHYLVLKKVRFHGFPKRGNFVPKLC